MKKLNIGIDLDNTLYLLNVVEEASRLHGMELSSKNLPSWDFSDVGFPEYIVDTIFALFDEPEFMGNLVPFGGSEHRLEEWKKQGHKIHVITARSKPIHLATLKMLNRHFGHGFFESIRFVERGQNKLHHFQKLKLDVWIDDNPRDIGLAIEEHIMTYVIQNDFTTYNQNITDTYKKYRPNWIESVKYVYDINLEKKFND